MAKRNADLTKIDPMFYIPEGAVGFEYTDDEEFFTTDLAVDEEEDELLEEDDLEEDDYDEPGFPDILGITQVIRTNATGNQVVDLTIEVENTESQYEFRVVKV